MSDRRAAAADIVRTCRRLYQRGLIAGPDGNVSVRLGRDVILATPAGMSKVDVTAGDLVEVRLDGSRRRGRHAPSSELAMHLAAYNVRPDVMAVVHAHPPVATAFTVAGESLMDGILPEVILQMGEVPLVPYVEPGTQALADALAPHFAKHNALLMANHGATTLGSSLCIAYQRMESLEHAAGILWHARMLGNVNRLGTDAVQVLLERSWLMAEDDARMPRQRTGRR